MIDTMGKKVYSSYAEIDRDLEILKLERSLYLEKMKLSIDNSKQKLQPASLLSSYLGISGKLKLSTVFSVVKTTLPLIILFIKNRKDRSKGAV